jgi:hypothetical protein
MNVDHKKVKMHWLQHPNQSNLDNLSNIRREGSRHFRNNKKQCLKSKLTDLKVKRKIREVQDEKGDLVAVSHSVLAGWRKRFSCSLCICLVILGNRNSYN